MLKALPHLKEAHQPYLHIQDLSSQHEVSDCVFKPETECHLSEIFNWTF